MNGSWIELIKNYVTIRKENIFLQRFSNKRLRIQFSWDCHPFCAKANQKLSALAALARVWKCLILDKQILLLNSYILSRSLPFSLDESKQIFKWQNYRIQERVSKMILLLLQKNCLRRSNLSALTKNLRYLPSYIFKEKTSVTQVKMNEILQFGEGTVYDLISGHALKKKHKDGRFHFWIHCQHCVQKFGA